MIWLLVGYMCLFIHRPFEIWPALGDLRIERIYILTVTAIALFSGQYRLRANPLNFAVVFFTLCALTSWFFGPFRHQLPGFPQDLDNWLKIVFFYFLVVALVHSDRDLRILIFGYLFAMALFVFHSIREYFLGRHGYSMGITRLLGINETFKHPNSFAITAIYSIPLCAFAYRQFTQRLFRSGIIVYVGSTVLAIVLSGSRSGLVGLLTASFAAFWKSRYRWLLLVAFLATAPVAWSLLPDDKKMRFWTLIDPSIGPANAQVSAEMRAESWRVGVDLFKQYPLFGCGIGAWTTASGMAITSHNLYGRILGETGLVGAFGFLVFLSTVFWQLRVTKKLALLEGPIASFHADLTRAIRDTFLLALLMGFAGGNLFHFIWVWMAGFLVVTQFAVEEADRRVTVEQS